MNDLTMLAPAAAGRQVIVIPHTHWDREWYRPFQEFRARLVETLDSLVDLLLARPDVPHFCLDGQSILLEDYLALRPERAAAVRDLVAAGRLTAGPWYVQPDEFLVSGEALIRNLLWGRRLARDLGGVWPVAWLPDTFGHVAQLPQLLRNFGIDTFVFARGLGAYPAAARLEFWWQAPNGDSVLALHQAAGYWNGGNLGYPSFWGDTRGLDADPGRAAAQLQALVDLLAPQAATPTLAVWNGADHMPIQRSLPDLLPALSARLGCPVRLGSVIDYAAAVRAAGGALDRVQGELRGSRFQSILAGTLSSRVYLKQANHRLQRLLEREAEPLAALAWLGGAPPPGPQLGEAWRLLLHNQTHDGLCGCSVDAVHREMMARFEQAHQLGAWAAGRSFKALARQVAGPPAAAGEIQVLVVNSLGQPRDEVAEVELRLGRCAPAYRVRGPQGQDGEVQILSRRIESYDWLCRRVTAGEVVAQASFWRECLRELDGLDIASFDGPRAAGGDAQSLHLYLADEAACPPGVLDRLLAEVDRCPVGTPLRLSAAFTVVRLAFRARVPACGYALYTLRETRSSRAGQPRLQSTASTLENEFLRVEVDPQGRYFLTDKRTGQTFAGLGRLEDCADAGDTYDACPLDARILDGPATTRNEARGGLLATLRVRSTYRLPAALAAAGRQVALPVTTRLTLRAGSPLLEIATSVDNRARDHRLRVLFPTGLAGDLVHADGHLAVVARPARPAAGEGWIEAPAATAPHHTWFGSGDGRHGLAVLSEGLPEHEALPGDDGLTLALTLLRAVGQLSCADLPTRRGPAGPCRPTPDAQCLGPLAARYGLLPYSGDPLDAGVPGLAAAWDAPLLARPVVTAPGAGSWPALPEQAGLLALEPAGLLLSALKCAEAGGRLVVRFYNPGTTPLHGLVRFGLPVGRVWRALADETELDELQPLPAGPGVQIALPVGPAEIVTLLVERGKE